jgi:hypothetical protein
MSINFYESIPNGFPDDFYEVIEKYDDSWNKPNRHELFTEEELKQLLKLCRLSEKGAELRHGVDGFDLVSTDRGPIEAMLAAKQSPFPGLRRIF